MDRTANESQEKLQASAHWVWCVFVFVGAPPNPSHN